MKLGPVGGKMIHYDGRTDKHHEGNFYRCNVHSDIHTVRSPTDAHLLKLWLQFTLKLDGAI